MGRTSAVTGSVTLKRQGEKIVAADARFTADLTIHGVTKRVTLPLDVKAGGSQVEVVGSLTFPFSDFGMSAPNVGGIVTVESNPTLEVKLVLVRAA